MSTITYDSGGNISSDNYVDITSGVGGSSAFDTRQLTPRLFTTSETFPTNAVVEFSDASDVLSYLNNDSTAAEYLQSAFIFNYISKAIRTCNKVEIARWANTDTSAQVFGADAADLDDLIAYTSAELDVTLDGSTYSANGIDLSTAASYADVATALQSAISALDASLTATTVSYNSASGGFDVDTNGTADGALTFASDTSGFLSDIGLDSTAVFSTGIAAQSITNLLDATIELTNDFGGYAFVQDITSDEVEEAAIWNDGQNFNFMLSFKALKAELSSFYESLNGYGGVAMNGYDSDVTGEYPCFIASPN